MSAMNHLERALDGQNQFWKYLTTTLVAFVGAQIVGSIPLVAVISYQSIANGVSPNASNLADLSSYGISLNFGLFLMLLPFIVGLIALILLFKPLHKRTAIEVINGTNKVRWNRVYVGAVLWTLLGGLYLAIDYVSDPSNFIFQFDASSFVPLVVIALLIIPLQTTFEELLCRGYWAQGIAAWKRNRWLVMIIPGLLFGLLHSFNPEVEEYGFFAAMPQYIIIGLMLGLITVLDDGIELAMGVHAANNIFAALFVTTDASALQTPALFKQLVVDPHKETMVLTLMGILLVLVLAKRYKWDFGLLNKRIGNTVEVNL